MKNETPEELEGQPKPSDESKKKPAEAQKKKKDLDGARLPVLVEFTYTFSTLVLLFIGLTVAVTSFLNGAGLFAIVLRTGVAVAVMGGLLMLIASQVSSGMLFAQTVEQEEYQQAARERVEEPSSAGTRDNTEAS
ncbi:hypothetical protein FBQ81_03745 [Chloroflexi bacterium CFX6]|nr:hypothetical protein [Chloroflexi bacterium CFX6]